MAAQGAGKASKASQGSDSAEDAFAALLQQIMANPPQAQTTASASGTSGQGSLAGDSTAQSQALSAGNIAAAQLALDTQQSDPTGTQQAHHKHHRHQGQTDPALASGAQGGRSEMTPPVAVGAAGSAQSSLLGQAQA